VLSATQTALVDRLLANEMDMAFRRRARWLLARLDLHDGLRVLDLGCGPGWYTWALSRLGSLELVAIDTDSGRLQALAELQTGAELVTADASRLPFDDASFDRVLMSEVLEHVEDDAAALAEIRRVLRPGGVLALSVPHARYPWLWDPISRVWTGLGREPIRSGPIVGIWTNHVRLYEPAELVARVQTAGLDVLELDELTHASVPFAHFLLYGIGKPLLEKGLLTGRAAERVDRFTAERNDGNPLAPLNLVRRVLAAVDARDERPRARSPRTYVNIVLSARRS
jgi:SAM-dependent methyltransferase